MSFFNRNQLLKKQGVIRGADELSWVGDQEERLTAILYFAGLRLDVHQYVRLLQVA